MDLLVYFFFFQAEDGIRDKLVTGVQTCALPIWLMTRDEMQTSCCYALQDKTWVRDPDGNEWEVFVVLEDNLAETAACSCGDKLETATMDESASCGVNSSSRELEIAGTCCAR